MKTVKRISTINNNVVSLIEICPKTCDKTILVIGSVHGDEPQGKFLIDNYLASIQSMGESAQSKNRLLFIPCLNPDGLELNTRQNANGIDINRNFPTKNWAREPFASEYFGGENALSEAETKFVVEVLEEYSPDVILTMHAPYKVVNYDGPAKEISEKISEIINYPAQEDIGYPTPGSFGTYAGIERKIPTITLEVDEEIDMVELIEPFNKIMNYLATI